MKNTEIALDLHAKYSGKRMPRRVAAFICAIMAPDGSDEQHYYRLAESLYEKCECERNKGSDAHKTRMRAVYYYKKASVLRENRLGFE